MPRALVRWFVSGTVIVVLFATYSSAAPRPVSPQRGDVYDAVALLGLGTANVQPAPGVEPGTLVVLYGGWSFADLEQSAVGKRLLVPVPPTPGTDPWQAERLPAGSYAIDGETPVPAVLLVTALLADHLTRPAAEPGLPAHHGALLRRMDVLGCRGHSPPPGRIGLYWSEGRLHADREYCRVPGGGVWEASTD